MIKLFKRKSFDEKWNKVVSMLREHGVAVDDLINNLTSHGYDKPKIFSYLESYLKHIEKNQKWMLLQHLNIRQTLEVK
jgi:hypothetical protein